MRMWPLLLLLPVGGCSSDAAQGTESLGRPTCEFSHHPLQLKDVSPLGFTAEAALAAIAGTRTCAWTWSDPSELGQMTPAPAVTSAEISISYEDGGVEFVEGRRVGGDPEFRLFCPSTLLANATVSVRTEDGILERSFVLPIEFRSQGYGAASLDLRGTDLMDYSFTWSKDWANTSQTLWLWSDPTELIFGIIREEAHDEPILVGTETQGVGVVFRAAEYYCFPNEE